MMTPAPDHGNQRLGAEDRTRLRDALLQVAPWLAEPEVGPRAVDAGRCEACAERPRLLPTCGPAAAAALCRDCALAAGDDAWCDGHRDDGRAARRWAASLPDRWADLVVLWWISTGELGVSAGQTIGREGLPTGLLALLPPR
ncbi:MAG: hypothetical protein WD638_12770 [Nitriliruptoraceae bacterium]